LTCRRASVDSWRFKSVPIVRLIMTGASDTSRVGEFGHDVVLAQDAVTEFVRGVSQVL
jgi:hypothetical protein